MLQPTPNDKTKPAFGWRGAVPWSPDDPHPAGQGDRIFLPLPLGEDRGEGPGRLDAPESISPTSWRIVPALAVFYIACVAVAVPPMVRGFGSRLPGFLVDELQHLWLLRWYKTCVVEGRSIVLCPEIQYPVGAPLGNFSPLHVQAFLYLPLSALIRDDILCFNLLWLIGLVTTGLGTFVLASTVVGDRWCAAFGGMVAMLSGPMLLHAQGHLELLYLGGVPVFLAAWLPFVDSPSRRRLIGAAAAYLLVALSAAYYGAFATIPAAWYVVWRAARGRDWGWLGRRVPWLLGFVAMVLPLLALAFANQIWAQTHGYVESRPQFIFEKHGTALWTYVVPTSGHLLASLLPFDAYQAAGIDGSLMEKGSYLGVVTLALVFYAAVHAVRFQRAGYWWTLLALAAVLSCGARWRLGDHEVPLPMLWLWKHVPPFGVIRVPARFNLFVAVVAAILASAGLRQLLEHQRRPAARVAIATVVTVAALADLAQPWFATAEIPPLPLCYARLLKQNPRATFFEVPHTASGGSDLSALCAYWQSFHRGRTSAGYSGQANRPFDDLLTRNSPFLSGRLANPAYLRSPDDYLNRGQPRGKGEACFDVVYTTGENAVGFRDSVWLYLTMHGFDYLVIHKGRLAPADVFVALGRVEEQLRGANISDDAATAVYDRNRLGPPTRPVILTMRGWRAAADSGRRIRATEREAHLAVYNPDPARPLALALEAKAIREPRTVRLRSSATELARWVYPPGRTETRLSPPFCLPAGISDLVIESDAEATPVGSEQAALAWDFTPFSLKVSAVYLGAVPRVAAGPSRTN
jgi:hypothetical protein